MFPFGEFVVHGQFKTKLRKSFSLGLEMSDNFASRNVSKKQAFNGSYVVSFCAQVVNGDDQC